MIPDLGVIIAAGGSSQRYGEKDKLLEELAGLPVFLHSIRNFLPLTSAGNLIVAVRAEALAHYREITEKFLPHAPVVWVAGGSDRVKSVTNALNALALKKGFVAIHDAARPLATAALLEKVLERARITGGAIAANPVADSLKLADANGMIAAPVPRERVFHAESPQIFDIEKYREASLALGGTVPTDDAEIMRLSGFAVELVDSGQWNMKLTSQGDLEKLRMMLAGGGK